MSATLYGLPTPNDFIAFVNGQTKLGAAVSTINIDRFKAFNDVYGFSEADAFLGEVAETLQRICQGSLVARLYGSEFVVFTPDGRNAEAAAETVRAWAQQRSSDFQDCIDARVPTGRIGKDMKNTFTVTIGVAYITENTTSAENLIQAAKDATRGSKGNQVCVAPQA